MLIANLLELIIVRTDHETGNFIGLKVICLVFVWGIVSVLRPGPGFVPGSGFRPHSGTGFRPAAFLLTVVRIQTSGFRRQSMYSSSIILDGIYIPIAVLDILLIYFLWIFRESIISEVPETSPVVIFQQILGQKWSVVCKVYAFLWNLLWGFPRRTREVFLPSRKMDLLVLESILVSLWATKSFLLCRI